MTASAALLLLSTSVSGQTLLADGFESGSLDAWTAVNIAEPANTLAASPAAARTGSFGLLLDDVSSSGGFGYGNRLALNLDGGTTLAIRFFVRMTQSNGDGYTLLSWVRSSSGTQRSIAEVLIIHATAGGPGVLRLQGDNTQGTQTSVTTDASVSSTWQEIILVTRGIGSSAGERELWVDGQRLAVEAVDLAGMVPGLLELGAPFASRRWSGTLHLDDVLITASMPDGGGGGAADSGTSADGGSSADAGAAADGGVPVDGGATSDGGEPGPNVYDVGCGCGGAGPVPFAALALLIGLGLGVARRCNRPASGSAR